MTMLMLMATMRVIPYAYNISLFSPREDDPCSIPMDGEVNVG